MTTITIYLLHESIKTAEEAVAPGAEEHEIAEGNSIYGKLYVKRRPARPPKWSPLFEDYIDPKKLGQVQSSAAAFFVSAGGRLFALTFGSGRFILRPGVYEERFGLLTTLNSVQPDALRSVDKRGFVDDQNSRVQTSQASAAMEFGIDIERDLIRGIVGYEDATTHRGRLAGADALTAPLDTNVPGMRSVLRRYLKAFQSDAYKKQFPWVDQVRQLNNKSPLVEQLNALLVEKLETAWANDGKVDGCWLALPEVIDWALVHGFRFTGHHKEGVHSDIHLPGLVRAYPKETPTLDFLHSRYVMSVNEEHLPIDRWPIHRCLHCELDKDGKSFVLSSGHWFEVAKDFVDSVNAFVEKISTYPKALPIYNHSDEGAYNEAVVADGGGKFCLMDKKLLSVGGIYDRVEFCDVYGDHQIIHIKHYGSSAVLGHLFNQGLVSGELLKSDKDYPKTANEKLAAAHQLNDGENIPRDVSKYKVVFAVISQSSKPGLHLPFFAKVVLKGVCSRLREWGYGDVMLAKIECHPDHVLVQKLKPAKQARKGRKAK